MEFGFYDHEHPAPLSAPIKINLLVFLVCGLISFWLKWPALLYPNHIQGHFLDLSTNPDGTVWILTDGTFSYTVTYNETSSETKGLFCKTILYHYDPVRKKVLQKIITKFPKLPTEYCLVQRDHFILQTNRFQIEPWFLAAFDSKTGAQLFDMEKFCAKHSELKSGIARVYYQNNPASLKIETQDARKFIYLIEDDVLLPDEYELEKEKVHTYYQEKGLQDVFAFVEESSGNSSRQMLYRIHGSPADLAEEFYWPFARFEDQYYDLAMMTANPSYQTKFTFTHLTPGKIYLEPIMLWQDRERVIFLYQDKIGNEAKRYLSCVDSNGVTRWTIAPEKLFPQIMPGQKDPFLADRSAIKTFYSISGEQQGRVWVLKANHLGAIGFDLETGRELWRVKLKYSSYQEY